jgi:hypothetical protein
MAPFARPRLPEDRGTSERSKYFQPCDKNHTDWRRPCQEETITLPYRSGPDHEQQLFGRAVIAVIPVEDLLDSFWPSVERDLRQILIDPQPAWLVQGNIPDWSIMA